MIENYNFNIFIMFVLVVKDEFLIAISIKFQQTNCHLRDTTSFYPFKWSVSDYLLRWFELKCFQLAMGSFFFYRIAPVEIIITVFYSSLRFFCCLAWISFVCSFTTNNYNLFSVIKASLSSFIEHFLAAHLVRLNFEQV